MDPSTPQKKRAPGGAPAALAPATPPPGTLPPPPENTGTATSPARAPVPQPIPPRSPPIGGGAGSGGASPPTGTLSQTQGATQGQTRRSRVDLPTGPMRTSPSNSPPPRSLAGAGGAGVGFSYSGLIPAVAPSGAVAGVAGPGGGALSGVYLGALGFGGWGGGGGGGGSGGGGSGGSAQQHQPVQPLSLPPVSPASATSSGRFVVGVSPASASSSHQRGMFSMGSSVASGSTAEMMYSPSPSAGEPANGGRELQEAQRQNRARLGARELQTASVGSTNLSKGFTRQRAGSNSSSDGNGQSQGSVPVETVNSGIVGMGIGIDRPCETNASSEVGSIGGISEIGTGGDDDSDHSGEGVAAIVHTGAVGGGGGGGGVSVVVTGGSGSGEALGEYKVADEKDSHSSDKSRHIDSEDGEVDGLLGSLFLNSYGDHGAVATADGVSVGAVGGGAEGWARVRGARGGPRYHRHQHPRIRPIHVSPRATPTNVSRNTSTGDSGLGGMEFLYSPGGAGALDAFCSPLSEATAAAAGSEMTQAAKLATSVRFGGVGDIKANLDRAEKSQLMGRDGEGVSLLSHAAQRGETEVFRVVLEFLGDKLTVEEVLAEFCAQDEDGQTPLLFAARSGSGAVFRQALEALLARATPEKVLHELTAKEKGDWTPLMAAAESGSVECFHEVLRAIRERGSEDRVLSELTTKDNGGWTPLMFASRSGNRSVFMAALHAFIDRGEEGSRVLKEQLLMGSADRQRGSILERVAMAGWLSRGPELPSAVLDLLESAWDDLERSLDGGMLVSADQEAFQHAVRQRDLLGLSCVLSHGFGMSAALIEGLVESCGPRCVKDCFLQAVASARNPLVPSLRLLSSLSGATKAASCPLHTSWYTFMQRTLEKLVLQVLTNLPVSARALNKRGIGGGSCNIFSGTSSFGSINSAASMMASGGGGGGMCYNRHRRLGGIFNSGSASAAETTTAASIDHTTPPFFSRRNTKGGNGGVNGHRTMGSSARGLGEPSAHDAAPGKATDYSGSCAVIYKARAKESLVVAGWIFEPEAEAVGMRSSAFEGPLAAALRLGWGEFICSPLVQDLLQEKLTTGWDVEMAPSTCKSTQWYSNQVGPSTGAVAGAAGLPAHNSSAAAAAAVAAAAVAASTTTGAEVGDARRPTRGCLKNVAAGGWDITVAPSLQALLQGVTTRPDVFFRVPAVRLALDGVIHLLMLVVYTIVLYRVEADSIDPLEVLLYIWVLGTGVNQIMGGATRHANAERGEVGTTAKTLARKEGNKQQQERKQPSEQGSGRRASWCCPPFFEGTVTTVVLTTALLCRLGDYLQDLEGDAREGEAINETWGFYEAFLTLLAASAPLLLFDLLGAVATFIPVLGPFVESIALLAREACKVIPTLACLLLGTALALHVMYGKGSSLLEETDYTEGFVEGFQTFATSCGTVARAGLGDIRVPDGSVPYGEPLYVLIYMFAAAGALSLVCILVGVLSNAKAARPEEMERQFHLSRARVIVRAAEVAKGNHLPAPLNLVQGGLALVVSATQYHRQPSEKRKMVSGACSLLGRCMIWIVLGPCALGSAVVLNFASLFWFWWISLKHVLEIPRQSPRTMLTLTRTTLWCCVGVPVRLLVSWLTAVTRVLEGDRTSQQARSALRKTALRGRVGGDYDLSRLLRRTRWGAGGGSNSVTQGCTVADIIAAMEDPLERGCCFRNVSSCFADEGPSTVAQMKALAKRNHEHQARTADRLEALEVAVISTLSRMDAVSEETARVQQEYLASQSQYVQR
ncbi:unnamed protein product [Scytosiphon promiscuus]